jgi:hypothetical protein
VLALTFDITSYEAILFLIGAVFVPLVGVFVVAYQLRLRRVWELSETARARIDRMLQALDGRVP